MRTRTGGDAHARSAEFLDPFLRPAWQRFGPAVQRALAPAAGLDGGALELGSGSGAALPWIAGALPAHVRELQRGGFDRAQVHWSAGRDAVVVATA
ncbi:hypothetical protein [Kineococcus sp. SYSU DK006]|uniref:hypothetical protein n=1 Tax=Kineococcus sp. SYSU DK006 TaxID=3383127 RepID=UPI003D7DA9C3